MTSLGGILNIQWRGPVIGSTMAAPPARVRTDVPVSSATCMIANDVGVIEGPTITSTLFSAVSLRAAVVAAPGSEASSRIVTWILWPAVSLGHNLTVFRSGLPRDAAGPA